MTKKELIEALEKFPDDAKVYTWAGNRPQVLVEEVECAIYRYDMRTSLGWSAVSDNNIEGIYLE